MAETDFSDRCKSLVLELGLCARDEITEVRRLTGGVASDIAAVSFRDRTVCVKFALGKLNVAADWYAPIHRSRAEYAWLTTAGAAAPGCVPKVLGWSEGEHGFAMEFVAGPGVSLWKADLLAGRQEQGEAAAVASVLGRIHAASSAPGFDTTLFQNAADFEALRVEPYLRYTANRHPNLAAPLLSLAEGLANSRLALVHGDISPKNILLSDGQPIILDAECASMGDPAFDVAFCLNHLVLKSIHVPAIAASLRAAIGAFWAAYKSSIRWEASAVCERRVAALLPALMLARVDGKSPVEYLTQDEQQRVRNLAMPLVAAPPTNLKKFVQHLEQERAQ
ncbi:aminoglycoside phosphotransferase family protein [Devosia rhodophyticola]|uniref:Aminoglycoside phosphotransferase family protein n=1 Tax=Devosia rhodophyticola TaxID=3026423 RepID=A0ABY7Z0D3_9HYPH|nr:aminoglycoside phosphotransferase family protein [Devosia rhodophyticola]WDR06982.1 aminoglycoside phosphotransferase family protein [Devosia rhodophyticola]